MHLVVLSATRVFFLVRQCGTGAVFKTLAAEPMSSLDQMGSFPLLRASERWNRMLATGQMYHTRSGARDCNEGVD